VQGQEVTVSIGTTYHGRQNVFINDERVVHADLIASNGVMHVINGVLLPPNNTPTQQIPEQLVRRIKSSIMRRGRASETIEGPWPTCTTSIRTVRLDATECKDYILGFDHRLNIFLVPEGTGVTLDYRTDRVRIYHDADFNVISIPARG